MSSLSFCTSESENFRPMSRLIEKSVFSGFVTDWRFAVTPTRRSLFRETATMDGVVRAPSRFSTTRGLPPSMTAIHELVVPRSIPRTFDIEVVMNVMDDVVFRRIPRLLLWGEKQRVELLFLFYRDLNGLGL